MTDTTTHPMAAPIARLTTELNGRQYTPDANGALMPVDTIAAEDLLEDDVVRKIVGYAVPLSEQVARFRQHTFDDVDGFIALLAQEHNAKVGGVKGNLQLVSYDGLLKVQVAVAKIVDFGPQLQVAKSLVDECLVEWASTAPAELAAVVSDSFDVDQKGRVSPAKLMRLLRYNFTDERWQRGMKAIRDSMRPIGSKRYVRCYRRATTTSAWEAIVIDVASA